DGPVDDASNALAHLLHRLALGNAGCPDRPARLLGLDVGGPPPLVDAVVPLEEIVGHGSDVAVAGEPAGLARALQGAREDQCERSPAEMPPERLGLMPPRLGQR